MDLIVQKREKFGKQTQALRREGLIPAELYGHGLENLHLSVPAKEFTKVFKQAGESTLINIVLENEKRPVMIHDLSRHPLTDEILNIDFYQVRLDERIKVKVPLNFTGEAPAVKERGGVLIKAMHEIEVEALPQNIPPSLEASLLKLTDLNQSLHVKDLNIPEGIKLLVNPETVIATVKERAAEEVVAAAPEAALESVKVETEEKKAERVAKKTAGEEPTKSTKETPPKQPAAK